MTDFDWSQFGEPRSINDAGTRRWPHESSSAPDANDPLVRLSDAADTATDEYATAVANLTAAEIEWQEAWDTAYDECDEKSVAARDRYADKKVRSLWRVKREAEGALKEASKRLDTATKVLSAFQTMSRQVGAQT